MKYDLIVVGGGPAGCATAVTAARHGAKVLLLERGRYPRPKVCGEFISPESVAVLSSLLLLEDRLRLIDVAQQIAEVRIFVDRHTIRAPITPYAISVTRHELDAALWRACEKAGVDARQNIAAERVAQGSTVYALGERFQASAVVDATGRWSNLRAQGVPKHKPHYIGLKGHFGEVKAPLSADLYFFPGGYCGVQPVADGTVNVCAMVRTDVASRLEDVFSLDPRLRIRARAWTALINPVSTFPLIFRAPTPVQDGVLNAGDAAGFIDPFVGDGISLALQTGLAAAEVLSAAWRNGESMNEAARSYAAEYDRRFRPVFRRAARVRRLFALPTPLRAVAAMVAQIPGVSAGLVRQTRAA